MLWPTPSILQSQQSSCSWWQPDLATSVTTDHVDHRSAAADILRRQIVSLVAATGRLPPKMWRTGAVAEQSSDQTILTEVVSRRHCDISLEYTFVSVFICR